MEDIPWTLLEPALEALASRQSETLLRHDIQPAEVLPNTPKPADEALYAQARQRGIELLGAGKVAALTVADGQGTRLGIDGPKGIVPVTPAGKRTLFELFAGMVSAALRRHHRLVHHDQSGQP